MTYLIEAAAQVEEEKKVDDEKPGKSDSISVVFCIDISGSMNGNRLGAAKNAIISQINSMAEKNPDRKIGLVAFDNVVDIYGDGVEKIFTIDNTNDQLHNFDALKTIGENHGDSHMKNSISETK